MKPTRNNPKLRFPEFKSDWKTIKLEKLFSFKNGINATKEQYGTGVKFINVLDIINNSFITHDLIIGRVDIDQTIFKKYMVEYGDVLFQRSSETREEVGQSNVYLDKEHNVTFGGFVIRGKKISDYNPSYINHLLKTDSARKEITTKSGGSTRYNVGQETLKQVTIYIAEIKEQEKIAGFLTQVDSKIEHLKNKYKYLKQYKKAIVQKIFNQKIRFKNNDGNNYPDWGVNKLGKLCKITTGKLDANAMVENGKYRFYTCAKNYFQIDNYAFDTDALLISGNGANVGYIHHYNGKFNAYQRTYILDGFKECIRFIKYFLDENLQIRILREVKEGNTPYIVMSTLTDMLVSFPSIEEQIKIASFLSDLDEKITQISNQLYDIQKFNKGLIQQMFV